MKKLTRSDDHCELVIGLLKQIQWYDGLQKEGVSGFTLSNFPALHHQHMIKVRNKFKVRATLEERKAIELNYLKIIY